MEDCPYSVLKDEGRSYELMLLRDQHGNTYSDLAREYGLSPTRVSELYYRIKRRQIKLYITHISVALGNENTSQVWKVCHDAFQSYQDWTDTCAYLEKRYRAILTEYRAGEPGMPDQFLKAIPPLRPKLSKKTIARIIELREAKNASFVAIAEELRITPAKAKEEYDLFYHPKTLALLAKMQEKAGSAEEKAAIWQSCFSEDQSAKKRYDALKNG